jgi:hypothetical protein
MMQRRNALAVIAAASLFGAAKAVADEARAAMSPAQIALFETPHLAALRPPLRLDYEFRRIEAGGEAILDSIRLELRATADAAGCCDVTPQFLTGPRAIRYPPAPGFRGNPLLLFALDRDTRELSAATGGSANWFRNRFRQALASTGELHPAEIEADGRRLAATVITVMPYLAEPRARRFQERRYSFTLAEAIPGWIQAIRSELPATGDAGAIVEDIVFAAAVPLPDGAR